MVNLCAHYNEKLLARDLPSNLKNFLGEFLIKSADISVFFYYVGIRLPEAFLHHIFRIFEWLKRLKNFEEPL